MKTIRTGVYALIKNENSILVVEKSRGPFKGFLDLPGGKIEHGEENIFALKRELKEELGISPKDSQIKNIISVEEDFVKHIWEGQEKDEHLIAIIYLVEICFQEINLNYSDILGDSNSIKIISINDKNYQKTNILEKVISKFKV